MKHLRLWCQGAHEAGNTKHPQTIINELGIKYEVPVPQSIADQWWFLNCDNIPDELPDYMEYIYLDDEDLVHWGVKF